MTATRTPLVALLAAAALALSGCAGGASQAPGAGEPSQSAPGQSAPDQSDAPLATGGDSAAPAAGAALTGMVGTADDPEAYEIALLDETGAPVTTLPAGEYTLTFADRSRMHNFRLTGPGGVDVATDVAGSDESTIEVTLEPGTYTFVCDPHPGSMQGEVEVTG